MQRSRKSNPTVKRARSNGTNSTGTNTAQSSSSRAMGALATMSSSASRVTAGYNATNYTSFQSTRTITTSSQNRGREGGVATLSKRSLSLGFDGVPLGPVDPILGITQAYNADSFPDKINIGVGAYRDEQGKPWVLPSVRAAERKIMEGNNNMEYAPIEGTAAFGNAANALVYGKDAAILQEGRVASCQSLSGTGALRLAAEFIRRYSMKPHDDQPDIVVSNPTWGNHYQIFEHAGLKVGHYRYWDPKTKGIDFTGMIDDLTALPSGTSVLLQSCAHNPTGQDPSMEQWKTISQVCKDRGLFVVFDNAYQGFASGDPERDIAPVRMFVQDGHQVAVCQSFAKNFGLYGQRTGNLSIVCRDDDEKHRVLSQVKIIARGMYSSPPIHGARIVSEILNDNALTEQWYDDIKTMSGRIIEMRQLLKHHLVEAGSQHNWDHITDQIGMFSYTGLTAEQCKQLTYDHHIFLTMNGRISMSGVTPHNVQRLAQAMHEVTKQ